MRLIAMGLAGAGSASSGSVAPGLGASGPATTLSTPVVTENEEQACS